jgi:hypothetical protein
MIVPGFLYVFAGVFNLSAQVKTSFSNIFSIELRIFLFRLIVFLKCARTALLVALAPIQLFEVFKQCFALRCVYCASSICLIMFLLFFFFFLYFFVIFFILIILFVCFFFSKNFKRRKRSWLNCTWQATCPSSSRTQRKISSVSSVAQSTF